VPRLAGVTFRWAGPAGEPLLGGWGYNGQTTIFGWRRAANQQIVGAARGRSSSNADALAPGNSSMRQLKRMFAGPTFIVSLSGLCGFIL
jgi:hypothetical protein